jgi:hypothetical protein
VIVGEFIFTLCDSGHFIVFDRRQTATGAAAKSAVKKIIKFDDAFDDFIHPNTYVNKLLFSGAKSTNSQQSTL